MAPPIASLPMAAPSAVPRQMPMTKPLCLRIRESPFVGSVIVTFSLTGYAPQLRAGGLDASGTLPRCALEELEQQC